MQCNLSEQHHPGACGNTSKHQSIIDEGHDAEEHSITSKWDHFKVSGDEATRQRSLRFETERSHACDVGVGHPVGHPEPLHATYTSMCSCERTDHRRTVKKVRDEHTSELTMPEANQLDFTIAECAGSLNL
jgi:hypothetical protein